MFNFWWLVGLFDELKPHLPPLSSQNYEMLIFGFCSTSDDQPGWSMDSNPICQPSAPKKMKCSFLDYVQLLMISQVCRWTWTLFTTCLQPKNEMLIFWLCSTSDDWPGWLMDSNPIHHPSRPKKIKSSFLYYVQFLMLARLVNGLKPHPPPLSSQKMKCSYFDYVQLLVISQAGQWTQTPSTTPLHPKKWNAHFWITFNFWWSAGLVDGLEPHPPPVSSQKMKCSYFDFVKLLMIGQTGQWTQTPSTTPLQPKKWNASFWITLNFWWLAGLSDGLKPHPPSLSSQKNEMLIFGLHSTFDDWPGWLMESNPIHHPSPAKRMKSSFLYYIELLMISWAGWWTRTPSTTPLQPKLWNAHFWIMFNFWWLVGLLDELKPHLPPLSSQRNEMLIFGLHSTSDDQPGLLMDLNPIHHLSAAKKWNAHILIMFNFWWLAGLFNGLEPHPPPLSTQKNEILIFVLCSTSDVG